MRIINIRFTDLSSLELAPKCKGFSDAKEDQDDSYVIHDNDDMKGNAYNEDKFADYWRDLLALPPQRTLSTH
ncbi:hypothetical protein L484_021915 [Morus notabilis]|uniref:Uncharacterized protein n=1 Tax=Morus notabilis TaxID=981085 RepID=W9SSY5_9ROSA|nr:hypothetical protein L484_021915 [Morus notabilis]